MILRQRKYGMIGLAAFLLVAAVSSFTMVVVSWPALANDGELLLAPDLQWHGVLYWLVFSLLAALTVTLTYYRYERLKRAGIVESASGLLGLAVGSIASACPICAPLLLVFLGIPLSFATLPFQGWEFRLAGLALLSFAAYAAVKSAEQQETCAVPAGQK